MRTALKLHLLIFFLMASSAFADTARIITRDNAIREDCRFFAPVKKKVVYNDIVEIVGRDGDWIRVRYKGVSGCIHNSAVDEKNVDISRVSGKKSHSATGDEVALAGKGFNPEVEKTFKQKHPELDFKAVDAIEAAKFSDDSIRKFISSGGLNQP